MRAMLTAILTLFALLVAHSLFASDFYPITEADKKFLAQAVKAVQKRDLAWIAEHMVYPISINTSNETRLVTTKEEFAVVLGHELTDSVLAKIEEAAKRPIFKNWKGVMIGDGIFWFSEYRSDEQSTWTPGILAIGNFAYQPKKEEALIRVVGPYPDSPSRTT